MTPGRIGASASRLIEAWLWPGHDADQVRIFAGRLTAFVFSGFALGASSGLFGPLLLESQLALPFLLGWIACHG
jgi:hypothetical protein